MERDPRYRVIGWFFAVAVSLMLWALLWWAIGSLAA